MVDCVTSLGGTEIRFDDWNIDYAYSGTQKCLAAPPGLSPASLSNSAIDYIKKRKKLPSSWYLDLIGICNYWGKDHIAHQTTPINLVYALSEALNCAVQRQQEAALRAQAREAARKAVADGLPDVRAQAALDECYTLGMTSAEEPLVAQLEAIWVESSGALKATHRRRDQESWENAAGFHFTTRTKDGGAI